MLNGKTKSSHKNYYYVFLDTIITSITTLNNGPLQQVDTEVDFISIRARISFNPLLICFISASVSLFRAEITMMCLSLINYCYLRIDDTYEIVPGLSTDDIVFFRVSESF